jgi:hypothetical protein
MKHTLQKWIPLLSALVILIAAFLYINRESITEGFQTPAGIDPAIMCPIFVTQIKSFSESLKTQVDGTTMAASLATSIKGLCESFKKTGCTEDIAAICNEAK